MSTAAVDTTGHEPLTDEALRAAIGYLSDQVERLMTRLDDLDDELRDGPVVRSAEFTDRKLRFYEEHAPQLKRAAKLWEKLDREGRAPFAPGKLVEEVAAFRRSAPERRAARHGVPVDLFTGKPPETKADRAARRRALKIERHG